MHARTMQRRHFLSSSSAALGAASLSTLMPTARAAGRGAAPAHERSAKIGFRVARTIAPDDPEG